MKPELQELALLLRERNQIDTKIAAIIGRPVERSHLGEYIAAAIFDIGLAKSARNKGNDGVFLRGPLASRSVNVKFYGKREGYLDLAPNDAPDFYLVLTGPIGAATSSRGTIRPLIIEAVYLFESAALLAALDRREHSLGIHEPRSCPNEYWLAAEIWPRPRPALTLTDQQRESLALFASGS